MILMYHKVDVVAPTIWWVKASKFKRQILNLRSAGYRFVYLDDYRDPASEVCITFDDVYENVLIHAAPFLGLHNIPFEVFVVGDFIGGWSDWDPSEPLTRHMSMAHLHKTVQHGGRLQWHTRSHSYLPSIQDLSEIEFQLTVPKNLSSAFNSKCFNWLCYPGGGYDSRSREYAKRTFRGAVAVSCGSSDDRWALNRTAIDNETDLSLAYCGTQNEIYVSEAKKILPANPVETTDKSGRHNRFSHYLNKSKNRIRETFFAESARLKNGLRPVFNALGRIKSIFFG
jgi:peptidoglycan/xylan/chitin deacetylase (PgdA/CDA1 family)